ncbi:hypothetical protein U1Q18_016931, partial [Sarracenia purpurea var. burkii]
ACLALLERSFSRGFGETKEFDPKAIDGFGSLYGITKEGSGQEEDSGEVVPTDFQTRTEPPVLATMKSNSHRGRRRHFRRRRGKTDLRRKQWAEKKLPTDTSSTGAVSGGEREVREREQRRRSSSPPSPAFFFAGGCTSPTALKSQTETKFQKGLGEDFGKGIGFFWLLIRSCRSLRHKEDGFICLVEEDLR